MENYLLEKLKSYSASEAYPLHMPGHKRRIKPFSDFYSIDITEIEGFDNLFHAEEILLEAQKRAAKAYGAEESFYLVNGSTAGILAAVSAAVRGDGKILMARNCHKAAYHAVLLNRLNVTYLYPAIQWDYGMFGAVSPQQVEAALEKDPDIQAVFITSPTYDGVVSDIETIAGICHNRQIPLIVDEAHGAHFCFNSYFPESAVACGADLVINSMHKTLPSPTQTAILHVNGSLIDRNRLKKYLSIYQTSSPSYVFMAAMDACIQMITNERESLFGPFTEQLDAFRREMGQLRTLHLIDGTEDGFRAYAFDRSKILIGTPSGRGPELGRLLREQFLLEPEMCAENYVTAIMTVGDSAEGFDRFRQALLQIDEAWSKTGTGIPYQTQGRPDMKADICSENLLGIKADVRPGEQPEPVMSIYDAESRETETVSLADSVGRVSGEFVYLYPPGIPLVVPGEKISEQQLAQFRKYQSIGLKLQGTEDYTGNTIQVVI